MGFRIQLLSFIFLFHTATHAQRSAWDNCPRITPSISLSKDSFNSTEDIIISITLTNAKDSSQNVLFDIPKSSIYGPVNTHVSLVNKRTGKSVIKYSTKRTLESQIYDEATLRFYTKYVEPGGSVQGQYSLFNMAVTTMKNNQLPKGTYKMYISYCNQRSNTLEFAIK